MKSYTISAPDLAMHTSVLADYLEVLALGQYPLNVGYAELASIDRKQQANRRRQNIRDDVEQEISEETRQETNSRVFAELEQRAALLSKAYPFNIVTTDTGIGPSRPALQLEQERSSFSGVQKIYVCCLLISLLRDGLLDISDSKLSTNARVGEIFQICSCIAAGGYYKGSISSFGFPRATGDAFLPALKSVFARFGHFSVVGKLPPGYPASLKDAGIDIIGWRHFSDVGPSCEFLFGQVASGHNWEEKPVTHQAKLLVGNWLNGTGSLTEFSSAMFIPFPVDHRTPEDLSPSLRRSQTLMYNWTGYGTIFDRFRIASESVWIDQPLAKNSEEIDGFDRRGEIFDWVADVLNCAGNR